jgi:hypothetical protein
MGSYTRWYCFALMLDPVEGEHDGSHGVAPLGDIVNSCPIADTPGRLRLEWG